MKPIYKNTKLNCLINIEAPYNEKLHSNYYQYIITKVFVLFKGTFKFKYNMIMDRCL